MHLERIVIGLLLSLAVGLPAHKRGALSRGGVIGLLIIGSSLYIGGGWIWFAVLVTFVLSSSMLSHFRRTDKKFLDNIIVKSGPRDIAQAAANGGLASFISLIYLLQPSEIVFMSFLGCIAAVTADTWATELGVLSHSNPRLITTWSTVPPGTSGGVSAFGMTASVAGATLIGLATLVFIIVNQLFSAEPVVSIEWHLLIAIPALAGTLGSLLDSLLGATVQTIYYCDQCGIETEQPIHTCGAQTEQIKGWNWLNNEWVNFFCSVAGSVVAFVLYRMTCP